MMADVLRGQKDAVGQRFQKGSRLNQTGDRLKAKSADRFDLRRHFAELRNAVCREAKSFNTGEVFRTSMSLMLRGQRRANELPQVMFLR